jgi:hypothetical protein
MGAAASGAMPSGILNTKWLWPPVSSCIATCGIGLDVPWNAAVARVAAIRHAAILELAGESVRGVLAVVLVAAAALFAVWLQARIGLRSNTNRVADLDALLGFAADADGLANNLVADADGLWQCLS